MKRFLQLALFLTLTINSDGQIISKFSWNNNPVTKADVGPDAISISSIATSFLSGIFSTNGLNPGPAHTDIDMILPGSYFDVPGLDISCYFRREENEASFFKRGSNFNFSINGGKLSVVFMVSNGAGGFTTINSGNIFDIPNDHAFHKYHYRYTASTGVAKVWVDAVEVYNYSGTANRNMYWTGAGNAVIGSMMDATGRNVAVLDEMIIQNTAVAAALPLQLLSFTAETKANSVLLNWATNKEINTNRFEVQHSNDGLTFKTIKTLAAAGGYDNINKYSLIDASPNAGVNYYRLKMIDIDGHFTYSDVKKVSIAVSKTAISIFPNPATDFVTLQLNNQSGPYNLSVVSMDGKTIQQRTVQLNGGIQQVTIDLTKSREKGVMIIQWKNLTTNSQEVFKVVRN